MSLNWDIVRRVKKDFTEADVDAALAILKQAKAENPDWPNRLFRCAVYLADGDLEALQRAIALGKTDWRDLIVAGDQSWRRRRARVLRRFFGCAHKVLRRRRKKR